jgi:hypothetical protein
MLPARICRLGRLVALGLATLALTSPALGTAFSTDNSDVYIASNEDGWGVEMFQRGDVVFATIFTHDADNLPIFYTATLLYAGTDAGGSAIWVGDLYVNEGPWLGAPFDPSKIDRRKVGTMTYLAQFIESGSLTFSVDGVTVTKQINRLTFKLDNYAGNYLGAYKLIATSCANPSDDGTFYYGAVFNITQAANALTIVATESQGGSCTFPGDYMQFGQFGQSRGSFTCTNGIKGGHLIFEMNVTPGDFRGRILGTDNLGCSLTGNLSGIRQ